MLWCHFSSPPMSSRFYSWVNKRGSSFCTTSLNSFPRIWTSWPSIVREMSSSWGIDLTRLIPRTLTQQTSYVWLLLFCPDKAFYRSGREPVARDHQWRCLRPISFLNCAFWRWHHHYQQRLPNHGTAEWAFRSNNSDKPPARTQILSRTEVLKAVVFSSVAFRSRDIQHKLQRLQ